jgi:hypothetical protein
VRAVALRALIDGRATWSDGYHREWIDKSLGLARRVATIAGRDLARPASIEALISRAAADRSAVVRKIAADALIQHRRAGLRLPDVEQRLATDRNAAIRDRIAFLQRVSGVVTS